MATERLLGAIETTFRRARPARLRWLQNRAAARAADLFEYRLETARAGTLMADLLAIVRATSEQAPADLDADVLRLDIFRSLQLVLPPRRLPLLCFLPEPPSIWKSIDCYLSSGSSTLICAAVSDRMSAVSDLSQQSVSGLQSCTL